MRLVCGDARRLPFTDETFDGATAISTPEHVAGLHGDRQALSEIARVLRPGGQALVSVPFRHAGSIAELGTDRRLYQRHYSTTTLRTSRLERSGLAEHGRILYGEWLPFYRLATRVPAALDWLRRPWDSLITLLVLHPVNDATKASAVPIDLRKPHSQAAHQ